MELDEIYRRYGYYRNLVINKQFEGLDAQTRMSAFMDRLFAHPPESINDTGVIRISDYRNAKTTYIDAGRTEDIELPREDVIEFELQDGSTIIVRPSGTEPKMKLYVSTHDSDVEALEKRSFTLMRAARRLVAGE